jgi:hypothetical protein
VDVAAHRAGLMLAAASMSVVFFGEQGRGQTVDVTKMQRAELGN